MISRKSLPRMFVTQSMLEITLSSIIDEHTLDKRKCQWALTYAAQRNYFQRQKFNEYIVLNKIK